MLRIKEVLKEKGVTIQLLSTEVGITYANMNNIVNGKSTPSLPTLQKIAEVLHISITELFVPQVQPNDNTIKCPNCGTELELNMVDMVANKLAREYNVTPDQILKDASFAEFLDRLPDEVQKDILSGKIELK